MEYFIAKSSLLLLSAFLRPYVLDYIMWIGNILATKIVFSTSLQYWTLKVENDWYENFILIQTILFNVVVELQTKVPEEYAKFYNHKEGPY